LQGKNRKIPIFFCSKAAPDAYFHRKKRLFGADILICTRNDDVHSLPPQRHKAANCYQEIPEQAGV